MASVNPFPPGSNVSGIDTGCIAFIKANWHKDIVDQALVGFRNELELHDLDTSGLKIYDVPGAFEGPLLAKKILQAGKADLVVLAALVVDGGIYRHEFVAAAVVDGLMQVQLETGKPVLSVSLTPHHFHGGEEHQKYFHQHFLKKGAEAAQAALMVMTTKV